MARRGRDGEVVLLDGRHLVGEALASRVPVEVAAFASDAADGRLSELAARCAAAGAQVITVPAALLSSLTPVRQPTGVVALGRIAGATVDAALRAQPPQLVVVLDGVQDPGNVGAIVRVAEACGASAVLTGPRTADPFGWKALRGSMGSAFRLPIASAASLGDALRAARAAGLRIFATAPRGGTPLRRAMLAGPAAILVGAEGSGPSTEALDAADESLTIEMRAPVESLNVSVAAALVLYEAARQRADVVV